MKTIFTLLMATVISLPALAYDESRISITTAIRQDVQVLIDGKQVQERNGMFVLNNLRPGNHTIRIYRDVKNNGNRRIVNQNRKLVYSSTIYVRPSYHVDIMVNRFGKALVDQRALNSRNDNWEDEEWYDDGYKDDYRQAMQSQEFDQLLQRLRTQWFGRLGNARDALGRNYFSSTQVRQVLQLFVSDTDRLELAKHAYRNVVDKQNFSRIYELLSYSSQSELEKHVRSFRQ